MLPSVGSWTLAQLSWLPAAPADLKGRCATATSFRDLRHLAGYALNLNQLTTLSRAAFRMRDGAQSLPGSRPFRLRILGSANTQFLPAALCATGLRYGIDMAVDESSYGQMVQDSLSLDLTAPADAVLIAFDHHAVPGIDTLLAPVDSQSIAFAEMVVANVRRSHAGAIIVQTLAVPPDPLFGSADAAIAVSRRSAIRRFNDHLRNLAATPGICLFDVAAHAEAVGTFEWFDATAWVMAKLPFRLSLLPLYLDLLARLCAALAGVSRKCLVLDLDNTIWGGIIGDDGVEGLRLSPGDPVGEAFRSVQTMAHSLKTRGIVLAVCSKNDETCARAGFGHPGMILRESDVAAFHANWVDKASNLEAIARALNLRTDALVLLDDNPAEREQVRQALPDVFVPELPDDPAYYARALAWSGAFEAVSFTEEDRHRAEQYAANARRQEMVAGSRNLDEYLDSLEMVAEIGPARPCDIPRVAQLVAKSNQYNLTGRRHSESEIIAMTDTADVLVLQTRLRDRFGDNGLISVVICVRAPDGAWRIDTWVMSCRVLKRRVEEAVLDVLARLVIAADGSQLVGEFRPTGRNELVRDHYARLGFSASGDLGEAQQWVLDLSGYEPRNPPIAFGGGQ